MLTQTSPCGTVTTNTYSYANFALGELTSTQEGSKTATTYAYDSLSNVKDVHGQRHHRRHRGSDLLGATIWHRRQGGAR